MKSWTEWTDKELIDYCSLHCTTERALFHKDMVSKMFKLAGHDPNHYDLPEWLSLHAGMENLVRDARRKLRAA